MEFVNTSCQSCDDDCFQGDNLPEVVESVSKAQKQQASEIEQHQQLLITLQGELVKVRGQVGSLKEEVRECFRRTCLTQEKSAKKNSRCSELQQAIHSKVIENADMKQRIERADEERLRKNRMYQLCKDKMEKCKKSTLELEADSDYHKELVIQRRVVDEMENKRAELKAEVEIDKESGELLAKLRLEEESHQLQIVKTALQQTLHQLQQEVSKETSKQSGTKQDIDVLQKRNKAQLTRLRCQLKEAQLRNRQWSQESEQLEAQLQILNANNNNLLQQKD